MDSKSIGNTFLNLLYWIGGIVAVILLTALGLKSMFNTTFQIIIFYFAFGLVGLFIIAVMINMIHDYISKIVYKILEQEKLTRKKK